MTELLKFQTLEQSDKTIKKTEDVKKGINDKGIKHQKNIHTQKEYK